MYKGNYISISLRKSIFKIDIDKKESISQYDLNYQWFICLIIIFLGYIKMVYIVLLTKITLLMQSSMPI